MDGLMTGQVRLLLEIVGGLAVLYVVVRSVWAVLDWRADREMRAFVQAEVDDLQRASRAATRPTTDA